MVVVDEKVECDEFLVMQEMVILEKDQLHLLVIDTMVEHEGIMNTVRLIIDDMLETVVSE